MGICHLIPHKSSRVKGKSKEKGDKKALDGEEKDLKEDEEEEEQEIEEFDDCVLISCQFEAFKLKDLIPRTAMWRSNKFTMANAALFSIIGTEGKMLNLNVSLEEVSGKLRIGISQQSTRELITKRPTCGTISAYGSPTICIGGIGGVIKMIEIGAVQSPRDGGNIFSPGIVQGDPITSVSLSPSSNYCAYTLLTGSCGAFAVKRKDSRLTFLGICLMVHIIFLIDAFVKFMKK
ncbi:hypothetical protein ADUPG1_011723 [Aduncisulcus paluster]|uniref:AT-hook motif nuclear-localized protein n=1 Tax=Aduncisulcus paluster TaxID=2918883 RepID=A0ABQ5JWV7_9EUKA|nr:hypothetical protein ADUPG1_011723 [Aduncisulcus paluster]